MIIEKLKQSEKTKYYKLFQESLPMVYWKKQEDFVKKIWKSGDYHEKASGAIYDDNKILQGFLVIKKTNHPDIDENTAWISALFIKESARRKGYALSLLSYAKKILKDEKVETLLVGQDYDNFFSGIPNPTQENLAFFEAMGFVLNKHDHYDLEADVSKITSIDRFEKRPFEKKYFTETLQEKDKENVLRFLEKEFPGRWYFEMESYLKQKQPLLHVVILKDKEKQSIRGFCMLQVQKEKQGGLGPIGIGKADRGHMVGNYMLCNSLIQLRSLGATITCIDWTMLVAFYEQFEFVAVRTYRGAYLKLLSGGMK